MIRRCFVSLGLIVSLVVVGIAASAQNAVNATGNWNVTASGEIFATGIVRLAQQGPSVTGSYGQNGRIEGKFQTGSLQVDASWSDSRGSGWMTMVFAANGNGFSGEWGRPGSQPSGHFVATRSLHPLVAGRYQVNDAPEPGARVMTLHQLGLGVVGNFGSGTQLNGTMAPDSNNLTGTWKGSSGHGWINLRFADDSRSFEGEWGFASDTEPHARIVGSVVNHSELAVRGPWNIASSGDAFAASVLTFTQEGQTVTGSYKNGRLQGTLPRGSSVLTGTWRDAHGSGNFTFRFSGDGRSFQGTWSANGGGGGSIIGKRDIAASPALRE
jgi:hypothetical protein